MPAELEKKLGYAFKNKQVLKTALTHPSVKDKESYERLEFLGDSALNLAIADFLYKKFPEEEEGVLAKKRSTLVNGKALAKIACTIELGKFLALATSEERSRGRENISNLENAMEALIGAIYLDSGFVAAKRIIVKLFAELLENISEYKSEDPKSELQEILQAEGKNVPEYVLEKQEGPSHNPLFTIEVRAEGFKPARATANSKKAASIEAAKKMLEAIKNAD